MKEVIDLTFNEQTSHSEIRTLCKKAMEELQKVYSDSNLQKKNIDATADKKKKQIITELAKNLENKITTNTICIEIVNQLRGTVSESFIRKCLDEKYKDTHRSQNAKQQNRAQTTNPKTDPRKMMDGLKKVNEEYPKAITHDNPHYNDNLALLGVLDQEKAKESKDNEEEQLQEIVAIAGDNGNQMLIRRNESNSFNEDVHDDTKYPDLDSKTPLTEEDNPLPSSSSTDLLDEPRQQILSNKCSDCERKDKLIHLKNITIVELEQVIKKSTQLVSADKLADKTSMDRGKESIEQNIHFNLVIPFDDLRRDMVSNNRQITSDMNIVFSGNLNQETGKVSNPVWKITTK
jgi:hypothetical protein